MGIRQSRLLGHRLGQQKIIRQPATTLDARDPSVAASLSQGQLLNTKTMSWVGILQLKRTVLRSRTIEAKKQDSPFRDLPKTIGFDGFCCLCDEFDGLMVLQPWSQLC